MTINLSNQTVWSSPPAELGLSEEQWEFEQKWLQDFNDATDKTDWEQWKGYWRDDAFFSFCGASRIEGEVELGKYFKEHFKGYKWMKHEATRHSFDISRGIIYQSLVVSHVIQGDEEDRILPVEGITLIHKVIGESQVRGLEVYANLIPLVEWTKEVKLRSNS